MTKQQDLRIDQGLQHLRSGNLQEAENIFRAILKENPQDLVGLRCLALVAYEYKNYDAAIQLAQHTLSLHPDVQDIYLELGMSYFMQSKLDLNKFHKAIACFKKALELNPKHIDAMIMLTETYNAHNFHNEALNYCKQAIDLDPKNATTLITMGNLLLGSNDKEQALECFYKATKDKNKKALAYYSISLAKKFTDPNDQDLLAMQKALDKKTIPIPRDQIWLDFAIAKAYENLKDYDKAFEHLEKANKVKHDSLGLNFETIRKRFTHIKKVFNEDLFKQFADEPGYKESSPIFIVGMPRSGSSLVEQILSSHPKVEGVGEVRYLEQLSESFRHKPNSSPELPEITQLKPQSFYNLGEAYTNCLKQHYPETQFIIDKMLTNFFCIGIIKLILPNAKIVHCKRDPIATCFSAYKLLFISDEAQFTYDLKVLAEYYKLYEDLMQHWDELLPDFIYKIGYEELVENQEEQTRQLLDHCGLEWHDECLNFHKNTRSVRTASQTQVRKPIYKGASDFWRNYEKHLGVLSKAFSSES